MALDANVVGGVSGNKQEVDAVTKAAFAIAPQRRVTGTVAAINAELVLPINGEGSATIFLNGTGTFNATYSVQGTIDNVNYFDVLAFPLPQFCTGGTIPLAGQPILTEAVNAATVQRGLCVAVGGLQALRVRLTAYTSGSGALTMIADTAPSISPYVRDQKAATLAVTATGAVGTAVTATLPAVAGLRHYIDRVEVTQFIAATIASVATPAVVTTTNLPGNPALSLPQDYVAANVGKTVTQSIEFGGAGGAATALNTATTVVCPAVATAVIWRVNAFYRLGL
jgi:hypothetical protein